MSIRPPVPAMLTRPGSGVTIEHSTIARVPDRVLEQHARLGLDAGRPDRSGHLDPNRITEHHLGERDRVDPEIQDRPAADVFVPEPVPLVQLADESEVGGDRPHLADRTVGDQLADPPDDRQEARPHRFHDEHAPLARARSITSCAPASVTVNAFSTKHRLAAPRSQPWPPRGAGGAASRRTPRRPRVGEEFAVRAVARARTRARRRTPAPGPRRGRRRRTGPRRRRHRGRVPSSRRCHRWRSIPQRIGRSRPVASVPASSVTTRTLPTQHDVRSEQHPSRVER